MNIETYKIYILYICAGEQWKQKKRYDTIIRVKERKKNGPRKMKNGNFGRGWLTNNNKKSV